MPKQEGGSSSDYPLATRVRGLFEAEKQVRPAQVGFAGNVANFLSDDSRLMLAEAATGVGKTRGYLIPALLHREAAGGKVVVSTHTLTLLRQITQSDETVWVLDTVEKATGRRPTVVARYGMRNFLARSRIGQAYAARMGAGKGGAGSVDADVERAFEALGKAAVEGTGLIHDWIEEFGPLPCGLTAGDVCLLGTCPDSDMGRYRARGLEVETADLVVQTHAMTMIEALRGKCDADVLIIDEADAIPSVAAGMAERRVSLAMLASVVEAVVDAGEPVEQLRAAVDGFEVWTGGVRPEGKGALLVLPPGIVRDQALAHAGAIIDALRAAAREVGDPVLREAMTDMAEGLRRFVKIGPAEPFRGAAIVWLFGSVPAFAVSTLRPGRLVSRLWRDSGSGPAAVGKVLLTSATLDPPSDRNAEGNRFPAFEREIGIREKDEQSRFNVRVEPSVFGRLAFRLADRSVPRPGLEDEDGGFQSDPAWLDYVASMVKAAMAEKAGGSAGADGNRVLVLTTSYTDAEALADRVDGLEAHRRGTKLDGYIGAFRDNRDAALVTPAGWAGLNLPGLVKHLVVARLPFAPPNLVEDDLLRALLAARGMSGREIDGILMGRRMEETRRRLRQGLGRAIRAPKDAATVWIGDPRFPLPDVLVRDRRAKVSQGLAAPFTSFIATIPVRFRKEGIPPAWDEARIHGGGVSGC